MDQPLAQCSSVPPPRVTRFWCQVPWDLRTLSSDTGEVARGWLFVLGAQKHLTEPQSTCPDPTLSVQTSLTSW